MAGESSTRLFCRAQDKSFLPLVEVVAVLLEVVAHLKQQLLQLMKIERCKVVFGTL